MAGYQGYSMSNNAVDAYERGLLPVSKLKIKGLTPKQIRAHVKPAEWHHTSKRYNETDFFCPACVKHAFGIELVVVTEDDDCECVMCEHLVYLEDFGKCSPTV